MRKTTLFLILLVTFSTLLIAGCTQQQPVTTPASAPAVTTVPTIVVNQQGVAIIQTVTVQTTLPIVANVTNKTQTVMGNVTNQTQEKK